MSAIHECRERTARPLGNVEARNVETCETYLANILSNPLSMKQLSRIQIRNLIIDKMRNFEHIKQFLVTNDDMPMTWLISSTDCKSILATLINKLELPIALKRYLYEFPDVPDVPDDLDVFVQY